MELSKTFLSEAQEQSVPLCSHSCSVSERHLAAETSLPAIVSSFPMSILSPIPISYHFTLAGNAASYTSCRMLAERGMEANQQQQQQQ